MSVNSKSTKSIYVPVLSKKLAKKNVTYIDWERRFKAYAATKYFLPVTTDAEKAAKRAIEMNSLGMAFLHQAVESPKGIKLLEKSATADYPEGIAVEAMTSMKKQVCKD